MENQDYRANNKRIAKNTLLLYIRMLFIMAINLYTSRVILKILGVNDFGIYNVVGGVVIMFSVLTGSLSAAISRFFTFELGRKDTNKLQKIFTTSLTIQYLIAIVVFFLAETGGTFFLNYKLNINPDRLWAANWVLQCSILSFIIGIISLPYNAVIIAHERMKAFAYIGVLDVILKLTAVLILPFIQADRLVMYSIFVLLIVLIIRFIYGFYCSRNFEECKFSFSFEKPLMKEMLSFSGWNFIGASSAVLRDQGVNIVLNIFCGTAVNAARGVAMQVSHAVNMFSTNFMTALNPQITKSFASGEHDYMMQLIFKGSRFSYYLLYLLSFPILLNTEYILQLWLNIIPDYTVNFVRLILCFILLEALSYPLITLMLATGRIRNYQIVVGGFQMLNFPLSYLVMKMGKTPEYTLYVAISLSVCCLISRLIMLHRMVGLNIILFIKEVIFKIISVVCLSMLVPIILHIGGDLNSFWGFLLETFSAVVFVLLSIYIVGLNHEERFWICNSVLRLKNKLFRI